MRSYLYGNPSWEVVDSLAPVLDLGFSGVLQGRTWWVEFYGISPTQRYIQFRYVDGGTPAFSFVWLPV